jgi:GT2 family glycosyltransferase
VSYVVPCHWLGADIPAVLDERDKLVGMAATYSGATIVPPVPADQDRPEWSVMIPTYNCAHYLRETLASVLKHGQEPQHMQIEVVDDCSTCDDPAAVVEELGHGRVSYFRQPKNVGHTRNFNTCLARSRGRLVHILHGDDYVLEDFYPAMQRAFEARPDIGAAFCRHIFMDDRGHWQAFRTLERAECGVLDDWLERIAIGQRLQTPSIVVRREVYERLGGFNQRLTHCCEDWEMWVRIAASYPVWYEVKPLAAYRMHASSLTGSNMRTGENVRDCRRAIALMRAYLPRERAAELARLAEEACALGALRSARRALEAGDLRVPPTQLMEALKCCHTLPVLARAAVLSLLWLAQARKLGRNKVPR